MTVDLAQLKQLALVYAEVLTSHGIKAARSTTWSLTKRRKTILGHALWMCSEVRGMTDTDKANRWIGFIQGALWSTGFYTVDQLREHVINLKPKAQVLPPDQPDESRR